jgi:hypothetical protein
VTQEDQYAIIGKAHEDYLATKREFAAIEVRGTKIADAPRNLSEAILEPARVVVPMGMKTLYWMGCATRLYSGRLWRSS